MLEKHTWLLISIVGVLGIVAGIGDSVGGAGPFVSIEYNSITGSSWDLLVANQRVLADFIGTLTRITGLFLLSSSVLSLGVSLKSYRSGEKWSWYVLWILPLVLLSAESLEFVVGGSIFLKVLYGLSLLLSTAGLLLPARSFLGKTGSR